MRCKGLLGVVATAAVLGAAPAASAPPAAGVLVPGASLGGIEVGMSKRDVMRVWGERHGVCRNCPQTTWYFNFHPFGREGAGVVFRRGRVERVFTLWKPAGWRTDEGLELGASAATVEDEIPVSERIECGGYTALLARGASATSVFYLHREALWGFGLVRTGETPCL